MRVGSVIAPPPPVKGSPLPSVGEMLPLVIRPPPPTGPLPPGPPPTGPPPTVVVCAPTAIGRTAKAQIKRPHAETRRATSSATDEEKEKAKAFIGGRIKATHHAPLLAT